MGKITNRITVRDVQNDWRTIDGDDFKVPKNIRLISHELYEAQYTDGLLPVEKVEPWWISRVFSFLPFVSSILWAFKILRVADKNTVVIANGSIPLGNYICLLNFFFFGRTRTILFWDSHIEPVNPVKKYFARRCFLGSTLATHWSKKQPENYALEYDLPLSLFVFIPYKANHSKNDKIKVQALDFIFAGGNGKRDYETLVEAVRGTEVTLIISATDPSVQKTIKDLPNVIPLGAREPSFEKLMTAAKFIVIPMKSTGLKGGGEANFCNAMWHGKALIAMDEVSAQDYVAHGETGYIVQPGDVDSLKRYIVELWSDEEKCRAMGEKGKAIAKKYYTQNKGVRRVVKLACILGKERCGKLS